MTAGVLWGLAALSVALGEPNEVDRRYREQASVTVRSFSQWWPLGKVKYFIDTTGTDQRAPAPPLSGDDARIADAIAHWEERTCVRFTRCATRPACGRGYVRFVSHANLCSSPTGKQFMENLVTVHAGCAAMSLVHELGHTLGLAHEQSRNDRDAWVFIDTAEVLPGKEAQFEQGSGWRDVGAYDYASIMHYSAFAFARGSRPTIVAPEPIGQRGGLSDGDVEAVEFMYNKCQVIEAPSCVASQKAGVVHAIPHGAAWTVVFNMLYEPRARVVVTYDSTTAPAAQMSHSEDIAKGMGYASATFTPDASLAGQSFSIAATFTDSRDAGKTATCTVDVEVADTQAICFGIAGTDPSVCSGRGRCVDNADPRLKCVCDPPYGGIGCRGLASCPAEVVDTFDASLGVWKSSGVAVHDTSFKKAGAGSSRVESGSLLLGLTEPTKPQRVSFAMAGMPGRHPSLELRSGPASTPCVKVTTSGDSFHIDGVEVGPAYTTDVFFDVAVEFDWAHSEVQYFFNGEPALPSPAALSCNADGIHSVRFVSGGWLDEFNLHCETPSLSSPAPDTPAPGMPATTSAPATPAPPTNAPATPAPATSAPETSAPPTAAPAFQAATSAPATLQPATSAPETSAPATPAPATSAPETERPANCCTCVPGCDERAGNASTCDERPGNERAGNSCACDERAGNERPGNA
eukprot:TRINITY_DN2962_c0_g1_i5.p1 TRINITY_DN2962_c0_g1~~TRINITY_DN2962_c0_g1_i5.p1  ORF type:complete len:690 (+),score=87.66 TRINITY_DN2962_c0_g1_i5:48-2117(+)